MSRWQKTERRSPCVSSASGLERLSKSILACLMPPALRVSVRARCTKRSKARVASKVTYGSTCLLMPLPTNCQLLPAAGGARVPRGHAAAIRVRSAAGTQVYRSETCLWSRLQSECIDTCGQRLQDHAEEQEAWLSAARMANRQPAPIWPTPVKASRVSDTSAGYAARPMATTKGPALR
jgi:hypothetical protein